MPPGGTNPPELADFRPKGNRIRFGQSQPYLNDAVGGGGLYGMRKTTLLTAAALLGSPGLALAQNTPEENNPNVDAPFVRNIRADRPGQTITAQVLQPGRFQLETGFQRRFSGPGFAQSISGATLRIGFFNSMELRVSQPYFHNDPTIATETATVSASGWAPVVVGAKFMLSPNYNTRTQVAILVESAVPKSGSEGLRQQGWAYRMILITASLGLFRRNICMVLSQRYYCHYKVAMPYLMLNHFIPQTFAVRLPQHLHHIFWFQHLYIYACCWRQNLTYLIWL